MSGRGALALRRFKEEAVLAHVVGVFNISKILLGGFNTGKASLKIPTAEMGYYRVHRWRLYLRCCEL
jgi:hypothetical protein